MGGIDMVKNRIYNTAYWMIDLGVSEEDARKFTKSSGKKIEVICPDCGTKKEMRIADIYRNKSISCICGDGISYSEKFMNNMLMQLNIKYITQLNKTTFKWCDKYKYDFYIPEYNMIIETHGEQHFKERTINSKFKRTLQEEQENDRIKKRLALKNGIEHYIILDCRYSELDYIKNSILNSELADILNLSKIDWLKCEEFALKNIVKEVCDYWNQKEDWETTSNLARVFNLDSSTIRDYLNKGCRLKWCEYSGKGESKRSAYRVGKSLGKKIKVFKNGTEIYDKIFNSCHELDELSEEIFGVKLNYSAISRVCRGVKPQYKGFTFKYIENNNIAC